MAASESGMEPMVPSGTQASDAPSMMESFGESAAASGVLDSASWLASPPELDPLPDPELLPEPLLEPELPPEPLADPELLPEPELDPLPEPELLPAPDSLPVQTDAWHVRPALHAVPLQHGDCSTPHVVESAASEDDASPADVLPAEAPEQPAAPVNAHDRLTTTPARQKNADPRII
jgi:hypothetical protein